MAIQALGCMIVGSDRADGWDVFATRLLGMQRVDRGGVRAFRMDDRRQRLIVSDTVGPATIG